jgi:hypothetical protein
VSLMEELGISVRQTTTKLPTREERISRHQAQRNRWVGDGRVDRRTADGVEVEAATSAPTPKVEVDVTDEAALKSMPLDQLQKLARAGYKHPGSPGSHLNHVSHSGKKAHGRRPQ